jgi:hypothetical protein
MPISTLVSARITPAVAARSTPFAYTASVILRSSAASSTPTLVSTSA